MIKKIKPFSAITYNQGKIKNIAKVVCPPYDVISPQQQKAYRKSSPYNFIHILLSKDSPGQDKYKAAAVLFNQWQKENILVKDRQPAIYFYRQDYKIGSRKNTRYGFIALIRLGEGKEKVHPHEHTRLAAKEDRLNLLREVRANLSPIFIIFPDKEKIISKIKDKYLPKIKPFIDIVDKEKVNQKIWRIDNEEVVSLIEKSMQKEDFFIADGHHRYEVACIFRRQMREKLGLENTPDQFSYLLAYFTNIDPKNLTVMPIHRIIKLKKPLDIAVFLKRLALNFKISEVKSQKIIFSLLAKARKEEHLLGMYRSKKFWLISLKDDKILDNIIPDKPEEFRRLDVCILNYLVLQQGLLSSSSGSRICPWRCSMPLNLLLIHCNRIPSSSSWWSR